jgi:hypothetical protein
MICFSYSFLGIKYTASSSDISDGTSVLQDKNFLFNLYVLILYVFFALHEYVIGKLFIYIDDPWNYLANVSKIWYRDLH